jgi:hypothetical protein
MDNYQVVKAPSGQAFPVVVKDDHQGNGVCCGVVHFDEASHSHTSGRGIYQMISIIRDKNLKIIRCF